MGAAPGHDSLSVLRALSNAETLPWPCQLPWGQEQGSAPHAQPSPWRGQVPQQPRACPPQRGQLAKINTDTFSQGFFLNTFINQC